MLPLSGVGRSVSNRTLSALLRRIVLAIILFCLLWQPQVTPVQAQNDYAARAAELLSAMSVAERVGQLFLVTFPGNALVADSDIVALITDYHIGGVVLSAESDNFVAGSSTASESAALINDLQRVALIGAASILTDTGGTDAVPPTATPLPAATALPLFVALQQDGDGPPFDQILNGLSSLPSPMAIGATWQPSVAGQVGEISGRELTALGVNLLLGPSLDIVESAVAVGGNGLGVNSFGGSPYWVGQMGRAYVEGVHIGGRGRIAVFGKHFPGFGGSDRPIGQEVATIGRSIEELRAFELVPFAAVTDMTNDRAATTNGLMTTHIRFQGLSGEGQTATGPITFDGQALQQLLALPEFSAWRAAGGLIVSDSLGSQAVRLFYDDTGVEFPHRRVARDALLAGQDLLLIDDFALQADDFAAQMANVRDTVTWFRERYESDPAFQLRVDDAALRILQQKLALYDGDFRLEQVLTEVDNLAETLSRPEDQASIFRVAKNAISLLISSQIELPRSLGPDHRVVIFTDVRDARQCGNCPPQPFISPTLLEEQIYAFYGPEGSEQIQLNQIRSFTYRDLKEFLTTLPEPTPSPASPTPSPTPTPVETATPEAASEEPATQVTPSPQPSPTPSVAESVGQALATANWIIFAALDVSPEAPDSDALNLFLAQRPDIVSDSGIVVLNFNTPYHLDTTELSKLSAAYAVYSKIEASVEAAVQALFQESPVIGAPPVSLPSINYDLESITQPDPDQIIDLYIEQGGTLQVPAREQPLEVVVGDTLRLVTGEIVDHNGKPVPDGTPVQFLQTDRLEGYTSFISQQPTEGGVARLEYVLEARTGLFRITAVAGAATSSQQVDIIIGENVRIVVVTLTPAPTPTDTPTVVPTATLTPSPAPTATATATPTPPPPEPGLSISLTTFSNLLGIFVGLTLTSVASIAIGRRLRLSGPSALLRLSLWGLLGGLVLYNYYVLQLPGSNWLAALGNWAGLVTTAGGGIVVLLVAAQAMQRDSSPDVS